MSRIKYQVITAVEEDLNVLGIYESLEDAQNAIRTDFTKAVGIATDELDSWLEEQDDAGIDEMSARALDSVTSDGQNHDWKIVMLASDYTGCRVASLEDEIIRMGTYQVTLTSGVVLEAPCRVNTATRKILDVQGTWTGLHNADISGCALILEDSAEKVDVVDLDSYIAYAKFDPEGAYQRLVGARESGSYHYSQSGFTFDEAIAKVALPEFKKPADIADVLTDEDIDSALEYLDMPTVKHNTALAVVSQWLDREEVFLNPLAEFQRQLVRDKEYESCDPIDAVRTLANEVLDIVNTKLATDYRNALPLSPVADAMKICGFEECLEMVRNALAFYIVGGEKFLKEKQYVLGISGSIRVWTYAIEEIIACMKKGVI